MGSPPFFQPSLSASAGETRLWKITFHNFSAKYPSTAQNISSTADDSQRKPTFHSFCLCIGDALRPVLLFTLWRAPSLHGLLLSYILHPLAFVTLSIILLMEIKIFPLHSWHWAMVSSLYKTAVQLKLLHMHSWHWSPGKQCSTLQFTHQQQYIGCNQHTVEPLYNGHFGNSHFWVIFAVI